MLHTRVRRVRCEKKAMRVATPSSKQARARLTVDDARDIYSRDATATFREKRLLKGQEALQ